MLKISVNFFCKKCGRKSPFPNSRINRVQSRILGQCPDSFRKDTFGKFLPRNTLKKHFFWKKNTFLSNITRSSMGLPDADKTGETFSNVIAGFTLGYQWLLGVGVSFSENSNEIVFIHYRWSFPTCNSLISCYFSKKFGTNFQKVQVYICTETFPS